MGEVLSIEEIEQRYAPDWVLINNPQTDENCRVLGGEVISTSRDRDELYRQATERNLHHIAVRYMGPWPDDEDMVFIL